MISCSILSMSASNARSGIRRSVIVGVVMIVACVVASSAETRAWQTRAVYNATKNSPMLSILEVERWTWNTVRRVQVRLVESSGGKKRHIKLPRAAPFLKAFRPLFWNGAARMERQRAWSLGQQLPTASPRIVGRPRYSLTTEKCRAILEKHAQHQNRGGQLYATVLRIRDTFATFEGIVFAAGLATSAIHQLAALKNVYWPTFESTFGAAGAWFDTVLATAANPSLTTKDLDLVDSIKWEIGYFFPRSKVRPGSACWQPHSDPITPCNSGVGTVLAVPRLVNAAGFYGLNYFHFTVESGLPQLLAFNAAGLFSQLSKDGVPWRLLVYDKPFVRDVLALLGIPATQVLFVEPHLVYFAHEMFVLGGLEGDTGEREQIALVAQGTLKAIRTAMDALLPPPTLQQPVRRKPRVVYIRRDGGVERSISNEKDMLTALRDRLPDMDLGIYEAAVKGVSYNLTEQVRWFREADLVIGVHGAALANLLWMRPNTAVLYLAPADATEAQGGTLPTLQDPRVYHCGANDFWLVGAAAGVRFHAMMVNGDHHSPVVVDVAAFHRFVDDFADGWITTLHHSGRKRQDL